MQVKNLNKSMFNNFERSQQASQVDLNSALEPRKKLDKPSVSDFKILELVGTGNFGKVHKSINIKHGRESALKILQKESVLQMKQVDHIISEREILNYLSNLEERCPYIIGIFGSFQDNENLYFELEYVPGCSLLH
jgi:protein kinase A